MNSVLNCFDQCFSSIEGCLGLDASDVAVSGSTRNNPYFRSDEGFQRLAVRVVVVCEPTGNINPFNEPAPLFACRTGNLDLLKAELAKDSSIVSKDYRTWSGSMFPLLVMAALKGHFELVELLLRHGANVSQAMKEGDGFTPLYISADRGDLEMVELLIRYRADVNQALNDGSAPLSCAADLGHLEVAERLIRNGADVNQPTKDGCTPLIAGAKRGHLEMVKLLIRHGADVNHAAKDGITALYFAAQNGHKSIVKRLLDARADPKKKFNMYNICKCIVITMSPLQAAQMFAKDEEIVKMIETALNEKSVKPVSILGHLNGRQHSSYGTIK